MWLLVFAFAGFFGYQELLDYQKKVEVQSVYLVLDQLYKAQQAQYFKAGRYIQSLKQAGIPERTEAGYKIVLQVAPDGRSYSATASKGFKNFTINSKGEFQEFDSSKGRNTSSQ